MAILFNFNGICVCIMMQCVVRVLNLTLVGVNCVVWNCSVLSMVFILL